MRILVVGSGGREHAICRSFLACPEVSTIFCAEGNAGISTIAQCVQIAATDIAGLADFAVANHIDLTFAGGETSLALGIADEFGRRGLKIVGVSGAAARLEASKSFAKDFMHRHGIPTAAYRVVESPGEGREVLESGEFGGPEHPVVVKADGLAAGKGVIVAQSRADAWAALDGLQQLVGSNAASTIVLEECLIGREVSLLAFSDGSDYRLMPPVRDHKRLGDGDTGPNTGGMGTVSDRVLLTEEDLAFIEERIMRPTLAGAASEGYPLRGILFVGLMMTSDGPRVLEYNVRFGDPETQVLLPLLETKLTDVCNAIIAGTIGDLDLRWSAGTSACVVLASRGYPGSPQKGDIIYGLDLAEKHDGVFVYHAGTAIDDHGHFVTNGGRVLGVSGVGPRIGEALDRAYLAVNDISWNGMQFRHDIGR